MSIRILVDMNLSPNWVPLFVQNGWPWTHWSAIGDGQATDRTIMEWASANNHVVFTHDLDFGTLLALTHASRPSVIQVRALDLLPDLLGNAVIAAAKQHESDLQLGAIIVVDPAKLHVRVLPI